MFFIFGQEKKYLLTLLGHSQYFLPIVETRDTYNESRGNDQHFTNF